jgi:MFS family permease
VSRHEPPASHETPINDLASIKVTESGRANNADRSAKLPFRREVAAGFRQLRSVPLLLQITTVTAVAFSVIGLNETIIFTVISEGLHRPPSFFGICGAVQGAGAIVGGIPLALLVRRIGSARVVGLSLAAFSLASAACMTGSLWLVLAAAFVDGIGLVWLVAAATTATQRYTPPSLQGRVNAAFMMLILTPQTVSIGAGAALISFVDYRLMLAVVAIAIAGCALVLLLRPAPEPAEDAMEPPWGTDGVGELADAPA